MSYGFQTTKKGFNYDFFPNALSVELFEASIDFSFKDSESFKIIKGVNEFEFTYGEFLDSLEYMIAKYSRASHFFNMTDRLNVFSIINGFNDTKFRFSVMSKAFEHQTRKKYIYAVDANRDELVKFVFNLENETITLQTNSNTEQTLNVYLNISDYNRILIKLFSLTEFGQKNMLIKEIVTKLVDLSEKHLIYCIETYQNAKEFQNTTGETYRSVEKEVKNLQLQWISDLKHYFKNRNNKKDA